MGCNATRQDCYALLDAQSEAVTRSAAGFSGLIAARPAVISEDQHELLSARYRYLKAWQAVTLRLFAESLAGSIPPSVARLFLGELPTHLASYHAELVSSVDISTPAYFRTDEALLGKILEVQCPGSLWGVYEQLYDYYTQHVSALADEPLSKKFSDGLFGLLKTEPKIHHFIDRSSHPAGERYFLQKARRYLRYFGYDKGVRPQDCNFVRAHDYLTLATEAFFPERRNAWAEGRLRYDLPPISIFEQKIQMCLPFWSETSSFYSDQIRDLFPYTTLLTADGLQLQCGEYIGLREFCNLPRQQRQYYLKYAGPDVSKYWGSRAVYNLAKLSSRSCGELTRRLLESKPREKWILQRAVTGKSDVEYVTQGLDLATANLHSKYSCFYGPQGLMGILLMHEKFYKVHGSDDTITTIVTSARRANTDG